MKTFDFGTHDEVAASQLEQQKRMLAEMIANANRPAFSGTAALANAGTQLLGQMDIARLNQEQREMAKQRDATKQAGYDKLAQLLVDGQNPNRRQQATELLRSGDPTLQKAALEILNKGPAELERVDLGDRIGFMDKATGQIVREVPKGVSPDTRFSRETVSADTRLTHSTPSAGALLTDDRTRTEGAANRGVQVRGQNLTDARSREATSVAAGTKTREDLDGLRKEFDALPEVKSFKEASPVLKSAKIAPDTPQGDLSLVYAVGKVLDPNSVVREGEMNLVLKSGSIMERMLGATRVNFGKGRLTPEMRQNLITMLEQRVGEYDKAHGAARSKYEGIAKERGYDPAQIFTDQMQSAPGGPKPGEVVDGWRFKGGNPKDKNSWEKA